MPIPLIVGDVVHTKKQHPCGSKSFVIMRTGMDFRMKCEGCGKEIWIERPKLEKRIKQVIRDGQDIPIKK